MAPSGIQKFFLTVASYTAIILAVMYVSGLERETTLYDRFVARIHAVELETNDLESSAVFYSKVLDFSPVQVPSSGGPHVYSLPHGGQFIVRETSEAITPTTVIAHVRVRNRFRNFHSKLKSRLKQHQGQTEAVLKKAFIGKITAVGKRKEFSVSDPDGNQIVFFRVKHID